MTEDFDAIVIGGGSGGVAFARTAGRLGARVCLIEKDRIGGTCVNRGCVPKKLMWQATWTHERTRAACAQGIAPTPPLPDFTRLQALIAAKLDTIRDSYRTGLEEAGVTIRHGTAALTAPGIVEIDGDRLGAAQIVLATGAKPQRPAFKGADLAQTSDDIFGWTDLPERLTLLGGGYIGCEFAAIFRGLGVEVDLIEPGERLLSGFDADIAAEALCILRQRGVRVHLGAAPCAITRADTALCVHLDTGAKVRADRVVAATGRAPRTRLPGGVTDGLETTENGALAVDGDLRTSQPGLYAVGDCADRLPLTPVATRDGEILAQRLFGGGNPPLIDLSLVARACFTMPPIAQIGTPDGAGCETGPDLSDGALTPKGHWTTRSARKIARDDRGLAGVAAMGFGAPDIVTALGAALPGSDTRAVTGIHPGTAEEFVGRD